MSSRRLVQITLFSLVLSCQILTGQDIVTPDSDLHPVTAFESAILEFEFPGLKIGTAEYEEGPTGCTIFYFPGGATAAVDVRGGAPGTINTDTLRLGYERPYISAITLAGGSAYGLETAAGVAAQILAERDYSGHWNDIAVVPGAIVFDLQTRRFNSVYPDKKLARAAFSAAQEGRFYQGARGAGRFTMQGSYFGTMLHSGQGGAFRQLGKTKVAVFTVVNAVGTVVDRKGEVVRCAVPDSGGCGSIDQLLQDRLERLTPDSHQEGLSQNTTITLVVTNQKLGYWALKRLAVQVHTSMSRAIQPFHTRTDGDTLFAASTGAVENPDLSPRDLGVLASEVAWDAVLASVPVLDDYRWGTFIKLENEALDGLTGKYSFGAGTVLTVSRVAGQLFVELTGKGNTYGFLPGEPAEVLPVSPTDFFRSDPASPRLHFELNDSGEAESLTLNPGHWPVRGVRIH